VTFVAALAAAAAARQNAKNVTFWRFWDWNRQQMNDDVLHSNLLQ